VHSLKEHQSPNKKPFRLSDVKAMFVEMKGSFANEETQRQSSGAQLPGMYGNRITMANHPTRPGVKIYQQCKECKGKGRIAIEARLLRCLCADVRYVQRVLKLVCYFHPPSVARLQFTV
jgi:hypothetical protein